MEPNDLSQFRRGLIGVLSGCAIMIGAAVAPAKAADLTPHDLIFLDRLTFGVNASSAAHLQAIGAERWLNEQLHPPASSALPPAVQSQVEAMADVHKLPFDILASFDAQAKSANQITDPDQKKAAQQVYQQAMNERGRRAAARAGRRARGAPGRGRRRGAGF